MRISTNMIYNQNMRSIMNNQRDLTITQDQLASGKRIASPSDDPVGASKIIRLTEELDKLEQYNKNINLLTNNLEQQETVFNQMKESMNRARVLTIQAGNAIVDGADRRAIGSEIEQIRDELYALMNTRNAQGDFIFAGSQNQSQAFSYNFGATDNKYQFVGDTDTNEVKISDSVSIRSTVSGQTVFADVFARKKVLDAGNTGLVPSKFIVQDQQSYNTFYDQFYSPVDATQNQFQLTVTAPNNISVVHVGSGTTLENLAYTPGEEFDFQGLAMNFTGGVGTTFDFELAPIERKNVVETLNDFALALQDPTISDGDYKNAINDMLVGIDNAADKIAVESSSLGARMNVAESVRNSNLDLEIASRKARSSIEDLDYAEATTRFAQQENAFNAVIATFPKVTNLSLFQYI
jgi:flagellar hook-associated protein 3 FlgL